MRNDLRLVPAPNVWTEERIRALGVRTDGVTACEIVYGIAKAGAYQRLRAGEVDFPVLRRGRRYIVPTKAILVLLGLEAPAAPEANAPAVAG